MNLFESGLSTAKLCHSIASIVLLYFCVLLVVRHLLQLIRVCRLFETPTGSTHLILELLVEVIGSSVVIEGVLVESHINCDAIDIIAISIWAIVSVPIVEVLIVILVLIGHHSMRRLIKMGVPALCALLIRVNIVLHVSDVFFRRVVTENFIRLFLCLDHVLHFANDISIDIGHSKTLFLTRLWLLLLNVALCLLK